MNDTTTAHPLLDDYAPEATPGWAHDGVGHHVFENPKFGRLEVGQVPGKSWDQWLFHEVAGGGSLVIGFTRRDGKLDKVMMLRANRFNLVGDADDWELPGGFVENGETKLAAGIRETLEETDQLVDPAPIAGRGYVGNRAFFALGNEDEGTSVFAFLLTTEQAAKVEQNEKLELMHWRVAIRKTRDALSGMAMVPKGRKRLFDHHIQPAILSFWSILYTSSCMSIPDPDEFHNYHPALYENTELRVATTSIPGLLVIDLVLHGDERGWFKETYQREKLEALGFPKSFEPVQNNVSSNREVGVTRGVHAEPWNKYITLTRGLVHVAIVDLRKGPNFGKVEQLALTPARAMYVPRGCGNSYQTLTADVEYTYLVDAHWSEDAQYTFVNLADPDLSIDWPIPLENAIMSYKDQNHPFLKDVTPMEV